MRQVQERLSRGLLWIALLLAAYHVTLRLSRNVGRLFGDAAGLGEVQDLARRAALVALALALAAAMAVGVPLALRRAGFGRRVVQIVPLWLVKLLAIGAIGAYFKVGTVGGLAEVDPIGDVTFAMAWLAVFGVLATVVIVPAAARAQLPPGAVRLANLLITGATLAALVVGGAMVTAASIVLRAAPSAPQGPPGAPTPDPAALAAMAAAAQRTFAVGAGVVAVTAVLALLAALAGWRARRDMTITARTANTPPGGLSELPGAAAAGLVLTAAVLLAIQPLRIATDNPPPTVAAVWDSPRTAELVGHACLDCHSNETRWPWYTHVAPMNWLTAGHVRSGRAAFNLSALDQLAPDRRASLGERMGRSLSRGSMPTADYLLLHRPARLTDAEKDELVEGLAKSLAVAP